jgi:hypothetical protein
MLLSLRNTFDVRPGLIGFTALMALTARPPFRNNMRRHDIAVDIIRQWALARYRKDFGRDHPEFGRDKGKRGPGDHEARLNALFLDFQKGVDAGRLFLSSLAAHDPAYRKDGMGKISFTVDGERSELTFPAVKHQKSIATLVAENEAKRAYERVDPKNIRQERWDKWLSVIHIAAAFAVTIDANERIFGPRPWIAHCRLMMADADRTDQADSIATIANAFLQKAEDFRLFQKANPYPVRVIE